MEADFGQIYVDFPEDRRLVPVLLLTWTHTYRSFAFGAAHRASGGDPARNAVGL
jgi:hypothetical protein